MHDHREIQALAAAGIDFDLDTDERRRLADALETCSLCRRQVAAMRATATVLRRPLDIGTPGRVRGVVIGSALGRNRRVPGLRSLLAAGLSIVVVLGGTLAFLGTRGLGLLPAASPSTAAPSQAVAAPSPSASVSPGPETSSIASASPTLGPSPDVTALQPGDVAAMVTDGRLVIRTLPATGASSAIFKTRLYPGQRVMVLEGPVGGDGYQWYRVRLSDIEGWASAADRDGTPWLTRVRNGAIAFVVDGGGTGESIHLVGGDDTTVESTLFTDATLRQFGQLSWSPDGRRLAFVATPVDSPSGSSEVFTIDADGSNLTRVTSNEVDDDSPAWSPDGTRLALRMAELDPATPEDSSVVVTPVDGPTPTVLGPGANPVWSPDGQQIALVAGDGRADYVWVQSPDGGGRRQVSGEPVTSAPSWSPDGLQLVVSYAGASISPAGLSRIDVASGSIVPLLGDPTSAPTWSVGGMIAFSATRTGASGLSTIEPDGTGRRQVLADRGFEAVATWSPDGRWLLLDDEHTGSPVTLLNPDSGEVVELESPDGIATSAAWQPRLP